MKDSVSPTITIILGALSDFRRINKVEIDGNLNLFDIEGLVRAIFIMSLKITSLKYSSYQKISQFLSIFNLVRKLSLTIYNIISRTKVPLDQVLWPSLEVLEITNGRVLELSMVAFMQRHASLSILRSRGTTIIGGS